MREAVAETRRRILDGSVAIYRGPIRDNAGRTVIPAGATTGIEDTALDGMNWLVEGVQGETR